MCALAKPKLGFRNKTALEQLAICRRVIASIRRASPEERQYVDLDGLKAVVTATGASQKRLLQLKADLRAETRLRNKLLREARLKATRANDGLVSGMNHRAERMRAAGMELRVRRRRSVGKPAKVINLRVQPATHASTVLLRYDRPLRDCAFLIQLRLEGEPESAWRQVHVCLQQRCEIKEGLKSGGQYWFRVCATNAHGPGPWSNPVSARVR